MGGLRETARVIVCTRGALPPLYLTDPKMAEPNSPV